MIPNPRLYPLFALPLLAFALLAHPVQADPKPEYVLAFVPLNWGGTPEQFRAAAHEQAGLFIAESGIERYAAVQVEIIEEPLNVFTLDDPTLDFQVVAFGLLHVPADRYIGLTDGDLVLGGFNSVAGWTSGPGATGMVSEAGYPVVSAHELGHTYELCDEYAYGYWVEQNALWGCPNPFPSQCSQDNQVCDGAPAPDGRNSIMGPAGLPGSYAFNQPSAEHLDRYFARLFAGGGSSGPAPTPNPVDPPEPRQPVPDLLLGGSELAVLRTSGERVTLLAQPVLHPAASPDGSWIAYASASSGDTELYLISVSGGQPRQITDSPGRDWHPAWLDGSTLLFSSERAGLEQVARMDLSSGAVEVLPGLPAPSSWPGVSAGGSLAFSAAPNGDWDLYAVELDPTGLPQPDTLRALYPAAGADIAPAWHPSGELIAFASVRAGTLDLYAAEPHGAEIAPLLQNYGNEWAPSWLADGRLVFQRYAGLELAVELLDPAAGSVTRMAGQAAWPSVFIPAR